MELRHPALEHGTTRSGRWLRARRVRIALLIAVLEAVLVVFDVISAWVALVIAGGVVGFHFLVGRRLPSDAARQTSWAAALSQVLVALVPVFALVIGALALLGVAVLAVVVLFVLLADRR